jgi:recombination DNA repair RAD52 pathway protein
MLTNAQLEQLFAPLNLSRVHTAPNVFGEYLEQHDVRAHLIRIFGFAGWDKEITYTREHLAQRDPGKLGGWDCSYSAHCRLTLKDQAGQVVSVHEDAGAGESLNQSSAGAAIDLAIKAAVSDSLKRAATDLGNQFGLSLYMGKANGQVRPSIVSRSLAHPLPEATVDPSN